MREYSSHIFYYLFICGFAVDVAVNKNRQLSEIYGTRSGTDSVHEYSLERLGSDITDHSLELESSGMVLGVGRI